MQKLMKFFKGEEGATAIEYSLIAGLVSVVAIAAWTAVGGNILTTMNAIAAAILG
jgi:pilus assembly protein Flp/PilA